MAPGKQGDYDVLYYIFIADYNLVNLIIELSELLLYVLVPLNALGCGHLKI
ncbi:MAG: hypothetical protein KKB85_02350 [Candidatus Altiarchaeota archaeon]|nr:hypothetical protein [Candidatus Altiarchaeota archaeon]